MGTHGGSIEARTPARAATRAPIVAALLSMASLLCAASAPAAPTPPSGSHPRLFLSAGTRTAMMQSMANKNSAVTALIGACQRAIDQPSGVDAISWTSVASECALAWQLTSDPKYATAGIKYWRAMLEDITTLGDKQACVAGADDAHAIASISRDSGFAIRFTGPHSALAYDWLHDAPGVTEALRQQTRDCFRRWITWYTTMGYHNGQAATNYHAGYVVSKALIAVAEGGEDGASSDLFWTDVVDNVFGKTMVANGLAQDNGGVPKGPFHGAMVGGDWPEGWQYGPGSVVEYALATRAIEEQGAALPAMSAWTSDLTLRWIYALLPDKGSMYVGGDTQATSYFVNRSYIALSASILGPSSDQAAGWANQLINSIFGTAHPPDLWLALADARAVTPADPLQAQLPLWYLARGPRNLYVRSAWTTDAFWAVFTSPPRVVDDHQHNDASNFVFTRGGDPLIVDPSPYASRSSLTGNALTVDSNVVMMGGGVSYVPSQTLSSTADMPLARGTASGVVAARSDFAGAFAFRTTPSDVKLAHRDWVFLPEGEIVTIDRITTPSATSKAYLRFRTPGTLVAGSGSPLIASAPSGSSKLAIHSVKLVPATPPVLRDIPAGDCGTTPFGACRAARAKVGEYAWEVPGPDVMAIHVLDGLALADAPADVAPIDAAPIDSAGQNAGVVGASVFRAQKQTFVLEPAAAIAPTTLTYGVPGANPSRHVVFDAPTDGMSRTTVTATAAGNRCVVTLSAGPGITGAPAIFTLSAAGAGCTVSEDANVPAGSVPPGSGGFEHPGGGGTTGGGTAGAGGAPGETGGGVTASGCGCRIEADRHRDGRTAAALLTFAVILATRRSRVRRSDRRR